MYTEKQIKEWITERLPKGIKSLTTSIRNSKEIQSYLYEYTKQYSDLTFSARANIIYNEQRPTCVVCNGLTYFNRNNWKFGETCSVKCAANNGRRNEQIKKTHIEKYGVDNILKSPFFKEQNKKNNLKKYGVETYMQSDDFKSKSKKTCVEKYGNEIYVKTEDFKNKYVESCLSKYGVLHYSQTELFNEQRKKTCIEKYGTDHHMKDVDVFEKQQKNSYYFKDYLMPSGQIARVQGYEPLALDLLLSKYEENNIIISNKKIFEMFGVFEYTINDKMFRYYPDIYLKNDNKFIEVKSIRTFEVNKNKNLLKRDCILSKGFSFEFWIFKKNNELIII
jgi:hypothetical protein